MSKLKKPLLILSAIILVLGIICMSISMMLVNFDVKALDLCGDPKKVSEFYDIQSVRSVLLHLTNSSIVIKQSDDEKIKITYYSTDCCPKNLSLSSNGEIRISDNSTYWLKDFTKGIFHGAKQWQLQTVIEIPKSCKNLNIVIETSNGSIAAKEFSAETLNIHTSNGRIDLSDISVKDVVADTSNSGITVNKLTADSAGLYTSNGGIEISDTTVSNNLAAHTSNGGINSKEVTADSFSANTSNGWIDISNLKAKSSIVMKTANGSIKGNIIGSPKDYVISSGTSNGNNSLAVYNKETEPNKNSISVHTSNGDIMVKFSK